LPASDPSERTDDRARLAQALRDGGAIALGFFRGQLRSWTKEHDSPVSEADIAVDELLRERLPQAGDGWLSEESAASPDRAASRRIWIVDPIDGTRAYIAGREDWCISAALVVAGRPVLSGLYAPVTDELFLATAGVGATRNGAAMAVSAGATLAGTRLAGPKRILDTMTAHDPTMVAVPRIHSLALRIARVGTGEIDGAIAGGSSHDWDLAAADLLVHEAGGAMTTLAGDEVIYNRPAPVHAPLVAAGRHRHAALLALIRGDPAAFQ